MFVTFLLIFRESLEAFLLVGILLAYLARMGERRRWIWIFLGVIAGLLGSVVAAFVLQVVVDQFSDQYYRTLLTAAIMLIAMVILTYMAVWMGKQSRDHTADAKRKLEAHVSAGRVFGIAALAFFSVLREGIESVLFLSALAYSGEAISLPGMVIGLVAAAALVWVILATTRSVPLAPFFRYSSLLLIVIAAGLLGSAVNQLQVLSIVPGPTAPLFNLSGILPDTTGVGIFLRGLFGYNATPTAAQFALWALYLIGALAVWKRGAARRG